jgi:uncharacterized membrane protein YdjX (TVP38/TMEM64 family)
VKRLRWLLLLLIPVLVLLVPLVFEEQLGQFATSTVEAARSRPLLVALLIIAALALDVFLPVPNGVTNTLAGAAFGFALGVPVIWCGLMGANLLGYAAGAFAGRPLARRMLGEQDVAKAHHFIERLGPVMLIVTRPVPVVAELATMAAGMARMALGRFVAVMALSNLAVAAIYAAIGSAAIAGSSPWLMIFGVVGLPLLAWLAYNGWAKRGR